MLEKDEYLFHIFQDYWKAALTGNRQVIFINTTENNSFDTFMDEFSSHMKAPAVPEIFRYRFENNDFSPPYYPFLDFLKSHYEKSDIRDAEDLFQQSGAYPCLKPVFSSYLHSGIAQRTEEVIPFQGEIEFERKKTLEALAGLFQSYSRKSPLIVIVENLQYAEESTLDFIRTIAERKDSAHILFLFSLDKDFQFQSKDKNTAWQEFVDNIDNLFPFLNYQNGPEVIKIPSKEPREEISASSCLNTLIRQSRNCFYFYAFQECKKTVLEAYDRIKNENIRISDEDRFTLFHTLGDVHLYLEEYDSALLYYNLLFNFLEDLNNVHEIHTVYRKISMVYLQDNNLEESKKYAQKALENTSAEEDAYHICQVYMLYLYYNNVDFIFDYIEQIHFLMKTLEKLAYWNTLSAVYTNGACLMALVKAGEIDNAFKYCKEGIQIALENRHLFRLSIAYHSLGMIYQSQESYEEAFMAYKECEKIRLKLGDKLELIRICNGIGYFCYSIEDYKNADIYYHKALDLLDGTNNYQEICVTLINIAMVYFFLREYSQTIKYLEDTLYIMNQLNMTELPFHSRSQIYPVLGIAYVQNEQIFKAIEFLNKARSTIKPDNSTHWFFSEILDALILKADKDFDESESHFREAIRILEEITYGNLMPYAYYELGMLLKLKKDNEAALSTFHKGLTYCGFSKYSFHRDLILKDSGEIPIMDKKIHLTQKNFNVDAIIKSARQEQNLQHLHNKIEEMNFLYNLQNILVRSFNREGLIQGVMYLINNSFLSEMCFLYLYQNREWVCSYSSKPPEELNIDFQKLSLELAEERKEQLFEEFRQDSRFRNKAGLIHSLISLPLLSADTLLGCLLFVSQRKEKIFTRDDLANLSIVSRQLSIALERIDLIQKQKNQLKYIHMTNQELAEKNRQMLRELEMARRVQEGMIAASYDVPLPEEIVAGAKCRFMESVGGDLIDILSLGRNRYGFLIADVSGHGVPAALITSMARSAFHTQTALYEKPAEVLRYVNQEIFSLLNDSDHYIAAYFGIIDLNTSQFQYSNAGHHSALLYRQGDKAIKPLDAEGNVIGFLEDCRFEEKAMELKPGDRLIFITDGIIEARNQNNEFYEQERLVEFIKKNSSVNPQEFVDLLFQNVSEFCGVRPATDDRAVLCIEYRGKQL